MTNTSIMIPMLWATIGLATAHKATALTDWFATVGTMSQCQFTTEHTAKQT
jgi:hypothetical protein